MPSPRPQHPSVIASAVTRPKTSHSTPTHAQYDVPEIQTVVADESLSLGLHAFCGIASEPSHALLIWRSASQSFPLSSGPQLTIVIAVTGSLDCARAITSSATSARIRMGIDVVLRT